MLDRDADDEGADHDADVRRSRQACRWRGRARPRGAVERAAPPSSGRAGLHRAEQERGDGERQGARAQGEDHVRERDHLMDVVTTRGRSSRSDTRRNRTRHATSHAEYSEFNHAMPCRCRGDGIERQEGDEPRRHGQGHGPATASARRLTSVRPRRAPARLCRPVPQDQGSGPTTQTSAAATSRLPALPRAVERETERRTDRERARRGDVVDAEGLPPVLGRGGPRREDARGRRT